MQSCCGFLPSFRTAGLFRSPSLNSYTLSSWILAVIVNIKPIQNQDPIFFSFSNLFFVYLLGLEFSLLLLLHMVLKKPGVVEEEVDLDRAEKAGPLDEILRLWNELEKPKRGV